MSFDDCGCQPVANCETCTPVCSGSHCTPTGWSMYDISPNNCEHRLFESTLCEVVDIQGFSIEYRLLLGREDYLWGEDPNNNLSYPTYSKVIYAPGDGGANLLDMFGLTSDETIQYMFIPKATFARDMGMLYNDVLGPNIAIKPRVGEKTAEKLCDDPILLKEMFEDPELGEEYKENYKRNIRLIDMNRIPDKLVDNLFQQYDTYELPDGKKIFQFLAKNKYRDLMNQINEIEFLCKTLVETANCTI